MKRRWTALLMVLALVLGLAGCGGNSSSGTKSSGSKEKKNSGTKYECDQVVYDQEDVKMTVTGYQITDTSSHAILIEVENNTESMIAVDKTSLNINGYMIDEYSEFMGSENISSILEMQKETGDDFDKFVENYFHTIDTGKTETVELSVYLNDSLEKYLGDVQQIDISMSAMKFTDPEDEETLGAEDLPWGEVVTVQTDAYDGELKLPEIEGDEIFNQDGIRIVVLGKELDEDKELTIDVFVENSSDKAVFVSDEDLSVNDFMMDAFLNVPYIMEAGVKVIGELSSFDEVDAETMDDIESLEFSIEVMDADTYTSIGTASYTME